MLNNPLRIARSITYLQHPPTPSRQMINFITLWSSIPALNSEQKILNVYGVIRELITDRPLNDVEIKLDKMHMNIVSFQKKYTS